VACRTARDKRELVRIVRTPDRRVVIDPTGRVAGRGAYLCADGSCWTRALEKGTIQRALETPLPEELADRLRSGMTGLAPAAARTSAPPQTTHTTIAEMTGGEPIGQE